MLCAKIIFIHNLTLCAPLAGGERKQLYGIQRDYIQVICSMILLSTPFSYFKNHADVYETRSLTRAVPRC